MNDDLRSLITPEARPTVEDKLRRAGELYELGLLLLRQQVRRDLLDAGEAEVEAEVSRRLDARSAGPSAPWFQVMTCWPSGEPLP
jgi:hypothetical protein